MSEKDVKQIACPKCGNTDLAFVNVIHSQKKTSGLLITILIVAILILIFLFSGITSQLQTLIKSESIVEKIANRLSLYSLIATIMEIFSVIILIFAFLKLVPYKNQNEIRYVCKKCGHHDDIDLINGKENEYDD